VTTTTRSSSVWNSLKLIIDPVPWIEKLISISTYGFWETWWSVGLFFLFYIIVPCRFIPYPQLTFYYICSIVFLLGRQASLCLGFLGNLQYVTSKRYGV
jgi:hypothetical protein